MAREVQAVSEVYCLIWCRLTQVIAEIGAVNDLLNELVVLLQVPLVPVYFFIHVHKNCRKFIINKVEIVGLAVGPLNLPLPLSGETLYATKLGGDDCQTV